MKNTKKIESLAEKTKNEKKWEIKVVSEKLLQINKSMKSIGSQSGH